MVEKIEDAQCSLGILPFPFVIPASFSISKPIITNALVLKETLRERFSIVTVQNLVCFRRRGIESNAVGLHRNHKSES